MKTGSTTITIYKDYRRTSLIEISDEDGIEIDAGFTHLSIPKYFIVLKELFEQLNRAVNQLLECLVYTNVEASSECITIQTSTYYNGVRIDKTSLVNTSSIYKHPLFRRIMELIRQIISRYFSIILNPNNFLRKDKEMVADDESDDGRLV